MERTYTAWVAMFEETKKRGARRPKVTGGHDVDEPEQLARLAREEPGRLALRLVLPPPPDLDLFEGFLDDAPHDAAFVVEGEQTDVDRIRAGTAAEMQMMSAAGMWPPMKQWRAKIEWSDAEGGWRVA